MKVAIMIIIIMKVARQDYHVYTTQLHDITTPLNTFSTHCQFMDLHPKQLDNTVSPVFMGRLDNLSHTWKLNCLRHYISM